MATKYSNIAWVILTSSFMIAMILEQNGCHAEEYCYRTLNGSYDDYKQPLMDCVSGVSYCPLDFNETEFNDTKMAMGMYYDSPTSQQLLCRCNDSFYRTDDGYCEPVPEMSTLGDVCYTDEECGDLMWCSMQPADQYGMCVCKLQKPNNHTGFCVDVEADLIETSCEKVIASGSNVNLDWQELCQTEKFPFWPGPGLRDVREAGIVTEITIVIAFHGNNPNISKTIDVNTGSYGELTLYSMMAYVTFPCVNGYLSVYVATSDGKKHKAVSHIPVVNPCPRNDGQGPDLTPKIYQGSSMFTGGYLDVYLHHPTSLGNVLPSTVTIHIENMGLETFRKPAGVPNSLLVYIMNPVRYGYMFSGNASSSSYVDPCGDGYRDMFDIWKPKADDQIVAMVGFDEDIGPGENISVHDVLGNEAYWEDFDYPRRFGCYNYNETFLVALLHHPFPSLQDVEECNNVKMIKIKLTTDYECMYDVPGTCSIASGVDSGRFKTLVTAHEIHDMNTKNFIFETLPRFSWKEKLFLDSEVDPLTDSDIEFRFRRMMLKRDYGRYAMVCKNALLKYRRILDAFDDDDASMYGDYNTNKIYSSDMYIDRANALIKFGDYNQAWHTLWNYEQYMYMMYHDVITKARFEGLKYFLGQMSFFMFDLHSYMYIDDDKMYHEIPDEWKEIYFANGVRHVVENIAKAFSYEMYIDYDSILSNASAALEYIDVLPNKKMSYGIKGIRRIMRACQSFALHHYYNNGMDESVCRLENERDMMVVQSIIMISQGHHFWERIAASRQLKTRKWHIEPACRNLGKNMTEMNYEEEGNEEMELCLAINSFTKPGKDGQNVGLPIATRMSADGWLEVASFYKMSKHRTELRWFPAGCCTREDCKNGYPRWPQYTLPDHVYTYMESAYGYYGSGSGGGYYGSGYYGSGYYGSGYYGSGYYGSGSGDYNYGSGSGSGYFGSGSGSGSGSGNHGYTESSTYGSGSGSGSGYPP